jgi:hypothetical protein
VIIIFNPQASFDDTTFLSTVDSPCSSESMDSCIESHIFEQLNSKTGCRVPWIANLLAVCNSVELLQMADDIVQA